MNIVNWQVFRQKFFTYLNDLSNFNFSVSNPVFWILFCMLLLVLLGKWKIKKALSFSLVIAIILLMATKIEAITINSFKKMGESFDGIIIRIITIILVCMVVMYYTFMKSDY